MDSAEALKILEESKSIVVDNSKTFKRSLERIDAVNKEIKELSKDPDKNSKILGYLNCALNFFTKKFNAYNEAIKEEAKAKEELEKKRIANKARFETRKAEHSMTSRKK